MAAPKVLKQQVPFILTYFRIQIRHILKKILYDFVQCAVQPVPNAIKGYYIMPPQKLHAPILGTPI